MPIPASENGPIVSQQDVLTLAEAAGYLRVPEEELLHLAERRDVPAVRIAGEWRFLRRALGHWLTFGPRFLKEYPHYPPWVFDHPVLDELLLAIEDRLLRRIESRSPKPGSKEAVGRHVGAFKDEGDLDDVLAGLAALRAAGPGEGGE